MNRSLLRGHAAMLGANLFWGLMSPVAKSVMAAGIISPLLLTDFRIVGAAILFWLASLTAPRQHVPPRDLALLAGAAMLGIVFNQGCFIFGVGFTSPGEASIITTTMPLWVMILAALLLKEPITWKKAGGILLGGGGALILVAGSVKSTGATNPMLGDILVLTAQLSYALYLTLYRNFIKRYSLLTLMKWMFTFAAITVLLFSMPKILTTAWSHVSGMQSAGIAYIVVGATFGSYLLVMIGQKTLRPTLVGMYNYVQPIVATGVGICLGLDTFTPVKGVAVVLIFTGVWLVNISRAASPQKPVENKPE